MRSTAPRWQCWLLCAGCAALGGIAFIRDESVPLLRGVNLGFHELGHLVFSIVPSNTVITAAAGSTMQCLVPLGLATYFFWRRKDPVGGAACLAWAATNFQEAAVYIADAPTQNLPLIGGDHDWATVLGPDHFDALDRAGAIAGFVHAVGFVLAVSAVVLAVTLLVRASTRRVAPADLQGSDGPAFPV